MRKMKKMAAVILAAIMVLAMGITSFAATGEGEQGQTNDGSITITNAKNGETYDIYKVFDLTYSGEGEAQTVAYTYNKTTEPDALYKALVRARQ